MPNNTSLLINFWIMVATLGFGGWFFLFRKRNASGNPVPRKVPPRFSISKDTTIITSPLDEDGYPDYGAALNQHFGAGIDPEQNMVVGLMGALGPRFDFDSSPGELFPSRFFSMLKMDPPPEKGEYLISLGAFLKQDASLTAEEKQAFREINQDLYDSRPWKSANFPLVARWLKANEKPLEQVIRASRFPQFYFPLADPLKEPDPSLYQWKAPFGLRCFFKILNTLISRAWLKTGEGDSQGAKEDLLAGRRIIQKIQPLSLMDCLNRSLMKFTLAKAEQNFLPFCGFDKKQLMEWYQEIEATKKDGSLADLCDICKRYDILQDACNFNRFGNQNFIDLGLFPPESKEQKKFLGLIDTDSLDWNHCLMEIKRGIDSLVEAFRIPISLERERELKKLSQEWKSSFDLLLKEAKSRKKWFKKSDGQEHFMAKFLSTLLLHTDTETIIKCQQTQDNREEEDRLFQITLELAIFHREKGHYPDSLERLTPACVKAIPLDIFTDRPHRYQKTEDGYLLYSVGPNRIDEHGNGVWDHPSGDDISVRVPLPPVPLKSR